MNPTPPIPFAGPVVSDDPTAGKHGGHPNSQAAWQALRDSVSFELQRVLCWLAERVDGTPKEYAAWVGKGFNAVSGRFSQGKMDGLIEETGERRERSGACRLTERGREVAGFCRRQ